jgi:enterochelin esterase-like enzyme
MKSHRFLPFFLALGLILVGCLPSETVPAAPTQGPADPLPPRSSTPTVLVTAVPTEYSATPTAAYAVPTEALLTPTDRSTTPTQFARPTLGDCEEKIGKLERLQIDSKLIARPLFFQLYLPPCYNPRAATRYPLLILLHGQNTDDLQLVRLGIVNAADRLIASSEIMPFIMVLPYEEYWLKDPPDSVFGRAIMEELFPWLDQHYLTCTERACRAIGGLSRGAGWAIHLGFTYWQQVGSVGAHSLPPFWGDSQRLNSWVKTIPAGQLPRIYMDIGKDDQFLKPASEFKILLAQNLVQLTWVVNDGKHDEAYWQAHLEEYLQWYNQGW